MCISLFLPVININSNSHHSIVTMFSVYFYQWLSNIEEIWYQLSYYVDNGLMNALERFYILKL